MINKYLPILHADLDLKELFQESLSLQFTKGKEILAPSSYPKSVNSQVNIIAPFNSCDICKRYLVVERKFKDFSWNSKNVIYLITCDKCKD